MSSMNHHRWLCPSPIFIFSFSCLLRRWGHSSSMLNRSNKIRHPCLNILPLNVMLTIGFLWYIFSYSRSVLLFQVCWEFLSWRGVGFCQMLFLQLLKLWFYFLFNSLKMMNYIGWFYYSFIKTKLVYSKLHIFKVCNLTLWHLYVPVKPKLWSKYWAYLSLPKIY